MGPLALYRRLVGVSIRSQLQYRTSFIMQTLGTMLLTIGEFLAVWALFARFGTLDGWTIGQVCVFYGITGISFTIADAMTAGFDEAAGMIRTGEFDRMLLRPRATVLMLLGHELTMRRVGRLVQATTVLAYGLATEASAPVAGTALVLVWTVCGSVSLFVALRILQTCLAFRTIEALEIMNVFTYGGRTTAGYPFDIFTGWFRRFFTFVIPLAAVSYYPGLVIMRVADPLGAPPWVGWISPAAGFAFLGASLLVWRYALRWYSSTGS